MLALIAGLLSAGCEEFQNQYRALELAEEAEGVAEEIAMLARRVDSQRQRVETREDELAQYEASVERFMTSHSFAVAALAFGVGGAGIALDESNRFTDEARAVAGVAAVLAALYAANNVEEVAFVARELAEADANVRSFELEIEGMETRLRSLRGELHERHEELSALNDQILFFGSDPALQVRTAARFSTCLINESGFTVEYEVRRGPADRWATYTQDSGYSRWFHAESGPVMNLRIDTDPTAEGRRILERALASMTTMDEPTCDSSAQYLIERSGAQLAVRALR